MEVFSLHLTRRFHSFNIVIVYSTHDKIKHMHVDWETTMLYASLNTHPFPSANKMSGNSKRSQYILYFALLKLAESFQVFVKKRSNSAAVGWLSWFKAIIEQKVDLKQLLKSPSLSPNRVSQPISNAIKFFPSGFFYRVIYTRQ